MNDWNQWEQHLNGWIPRRPSRRIKRRLFATAATAGDESVWPLSWNRIVATAALVFAVIIVGSGAYHDPVRASASHSTLKPGLHRPEETTFMRK